MNRAVFSNCPPDRRRLATLRAAPARTVASLIYLLAVYLLIIPVTHAIEKGFTRAESERVFDTQENYAVVVGINEYNQLGDLRYAERDAEALQTFFEQQGYTVLPLIGWRASAKDVLDFVSKVAKTVTNNGQEQRGTLVFAFSGHGFRNRSGENYLAMPRTEIDDDGDIVSGTALALNDVRQVMREYGVQQRVLFIDACRESTEGGARNVSSAQRGFSLDKEARGEAVLYSTEDKTLAYEDPQLQHGVFTYYLLQALEGKAASAEDGLVTFNQVKSYVARNVGRHVLKRFKETQLPYQAGERSALGEFVLARVEQDAAPVLEQPTDQQENPSWVIAEQRMRLNRSDRRDVQRRLSNAGYAVGPIDGLWGNRTRGALEQWQRDSDREATGYLDEGSYEVLVAELVLPEPPPPKPARKSFEPEMVRIKGGSFIMGSDDGANDEKPVRRVQIGSFEMGRYEVTFDEYDAFARATGRDLPDDRGWGRGKRPVINVSWNDSKAYIAWLNENTAGGYRLPSEAEWEYAARAGSEDKYSFGDSESELCTYGNGNSDRNDECDDSHKYTAPVGSYRPNGNGLSDMHGNVFEWVEDCWHKNYQGAPANGRVWLSEGDGDCGRRVLRGGSWSNFPDNLRSALRSRNSAAYRIVSVGFRVSRTLTP